MDALARAVSVVMTSIATGEDPNDILARGERGDEWTKKT
jgi:hypothetical protein